MNVAGYACWYYMLGRYGVNRVAPYLLLLPIASVTGGMIFLGETPSGSVLLGGAIVIGGVALIVVERGAQARRRRNEVSGKGEQRIARY